MESKIHFVCNAVKWFDKVNGNTYHSVRITRISDGKVICHEWTYGYNEHYRQTALQTMFKAGWLDNYLRKHEPIKNLKPEERHYTENNLSMFERENNYPIMWNVSEGLKRDMVANGKL